METIGGIVVLIAGYFVFSLPMRDGNLGEVAQALNTHLGF